MNNKKIWYQKPWLWLLIIFILIIFVSIPIIINLLYLSGTKEGIPNTVYSASDCLLFYGAVIGFMGTLFMGSIAFYQNRQLKKINDRMMRIEEEKHTPTVDIQKSNIDKIPEELIAEKISIIIDNCILDNNRKIETKLFVVKNISNVYINSLTLKKIKILKYVEKDINLVFEANTEDFKANQQIGAFLQVGELRYLSLDIPTEEMLNKQTYAYVMEFELTTVSGRKYLEKIDFANAIYVNNKKFMEPKKFETITNKDIKIEEITN